MRKEIVVLVGSSILLLAGCGGAQTDQAAKQAATTAPTVKAAATAAAPTVAAAATAAAPAVSTVVAGATAAAPTVSAAATRVAPTLVAGATAVAPTVTAAQTAAPTIAAAAGTAAAQLPLQITCFQLAPMPQMTVRNTGTAAVDMSGWAVRSGTASVSMPANARIAAGQTATVHFMPGTGTANDIYLGADVTPLIAALRPGATIELVNGQGQVMGRFQLP